MHFSCTRLPVLLNGIKGYKPALSRQLTWLHHYYRNALAEGSAACQSCGHNAKLWMRVADKLPLAWRALPGVHVNCNRCSATFSTTVRGLVLLLPEAQRFWREHARIRGIPEQEIESGGRTVLLSSLQSLNSAARLDVLVASDTFEVLAVHRVGTH